MATKSAPYLLADNQGRDGINVQSNPQGALVKRTGQTTFATTAASFNSLYPFEAAASPFLIGQGLGTVYSVSTGGTVTARFSTVSFTAPWEWVSAPAAGGKGPLYGVNGTDAPLQWDGTAGSMSGWTVTGGGTDPSGYLGAVPNGKYTLLHSNKVYMAGVASNVHRLFWCEINATDGTRPDRWPNQNYVDLDPGDGDAITGLGRVGPYLIVFKRRKTFIVMDPDTGANRRISATIGCCSHRSIVDTPGGTFFLSDDRGVYETNGSKIELISDAIQPNLDAIVPARRSQAAGVFYNGHYYLSICTSGATNNFTIDWDTALSSWWFQDIGTSQWAVWHPSGTTPTLYTARQNISQISQAFVPNTYTDYGSAFTWIWRGPWQSPTFYRRRRFPTPYFRKRWRQVRLDGSGTVDVYQANDFVSTPETLAKADVLNVGSQIGTQMIYQGRIYSLGVARAKSIIFRSTSSTADEVTSLVLFLSDRQD